MQSTEQLGNIGKIATGNYFDVVKKQHHLSGLAAIRVLIIDSDVHVSGMVKSILNRLSFKSIISIRDGADALETIDEHDIDLVISEWPMPSGMNKDIVRTIRTHHTDRAQTVPIILLTARGDRGTVYQARDAGVTEFIIKPFSVYSLCARIVNVIENPRHFIISPEYIGPDRRRIKTDENLATSRRMSEEEKRKKSVRRGKKTIITTPQGEVHVSDPDYTLRHRIGLDANARELLSEASVSAAQEVVEENLGQFHEWVGVDLVWLDHNFKLLQKGVNHDDSKNNMVEILLSLKSKAGLFHFDLAVQVSVSLTDYLETLTNYHKQHDIVIRKHIDILYVIFQKFIEGKGGEVGDEMIQVLDKLKKHIPAVRKE